MFKPRDKQSSFFDATYFCEKLIPEDSFYRKVREMVWLITDKGKIIMHDKIMKLIILGAVFFLLLVTPALASTAQYTYDNLGRLIQVVYDNGTTIVYTYDAAGNRTVQQVTTP